jgi:hypothetical protein
MNIPELRSIFVHYKAGQGAHSELCNQKKRAEQSARFLRIAIDIIF